MAKQEKNHTQKENQGVAETDARRMIDSDPETPGNMTDQTFGSWSGEKEAGTMRGKDLLEKLLLSNPETGGPPVLPVGSRAAVEDVLRLLLVDREELEAYSKELGRRIEDASADMTPGEPLTEDLLGRMLRKDFRSIPDAELVALMLAPTSLQAAALAVLDHLDVDPAVADAWDDDFAEAGGRIMRRHGEQVPRFD